MSNLTIEAVVCSPDDCIEAEAGGADRLELCSAMVLGGLTPSLGTLIEARATTALPIVCMIRPRAGGFCYTAREFATMLRDAELAVAYGARGLVFGLLEADGDIDAARTRALVERAGACETIFHRAFDVVPDPYAALETLVDLGVTRILTSGREPTALAGAPLIRALAIQAAGRIQILPGGGIREANIAALLESTGLAEVHLGPFTAQPDSSGRANPALSFASMSAPPEGHYPLTDRDALRRARRAASSDGAEQRHRAGRGADHAGER
jgi:copper homeostasis protein